MHPLLRRRAAGLLLHVTSLPSRHGIGDLGPEAHRLLAWLERAGLTWWQVLPVGPVGPFGSPYSSPSAFALEPLLASLERLADEGLLARGEVSASRSLRAGRLNWERARGFKAPRLGAAWRAFAARKGGTRAFDRFCADARDWLDPWAMRSWGGDPDEERFVQWVLDRQWADLRREAGERGVRILGDAPIFVDSGAVDVAARRELFRTGRDGRPTVVTGVPPDGFSPDGQKWGHPHYRWAAHRREDFAWWRARMRRQLALADAVRIDHFIGFVRAWEVPADAPTAREGRWRRQAGDELLAALAGELGDLPMVAEDLGETTPKVGALRDRHGLPGMRVLHFGLHEGSEHAPHALPRDVVAYSSTHDCDTTVWWYRGLSKADRARARALTGGKASTIGFDLARVAMNSPADLAVVAAQDLLNLGRSARMNVPGTVGGNWTWRLAQGALDAGLARRTRAVVEATHRLVH